MSKLLVVVGLTGNQGGSVAEVYSKEAGWKVRGITRNTSSPAAEAWKAKGVEVVQGDLDDTKSLIAAFKGADAIFSTTDFWGPFFNPATQTKVKSGQTVNEYVYEYELQQGKNIADAAATVEGLDRLIVSALCDAKKASKGKYSWVYHFDSKAHYVDYINEKYPDLAKKMSIVQVGSYMSNIKQAGPKKQADGSYRLMNVGSGKAKIPHFDTVADTGVVVRAALNLPPGKNILGAGDMLSWTDYLKVWCEVNNVPFGGYDAVPLQGFISFMPPGLGQELGEMLAFMDEFGYDGGDPSVVQASELGVPLTSWADYVKKQDWSSVLNAEPQPKQ
jgi:hypothetical protein